jgi:hypothetical protein
MTDHDDELQLTPVEPEQLKLEPHEPDDLGQLSPR